MTRYALVIGVSVYEHSRYFRNLPKAAADAQAVAQILRDHGNFYDVELLTQQVTGDTLYQRLEKFLRKAERHEALIYFAGHGFQASNRAGITTGYLAPSDCWSPETGIRLNDELTPLIHRSNLSSLIMLLDCCHAGLIHQDWELTRQVLKPDLSVFSTPRDYYLISACRSEEVAREGAAHGLFTEALLEALSPTHADSETGQISINQAFARIYQRLQGSGQEPFMLGGGRSLTVVQYSAAETIHPALNPALLPYRGLEPFEEAQAQFFFGRNEQIDTIWQRLNTGNFVAVIGASGSGKSSVVRAGLIPQLKCAGWGILEAIKPASTPLAKLRAAFDPFFSCTYEQQQLDALLNEEGMGLRRLSGHLPGTNRYLLLVDQFEELFTLTRSPQERECFINLLVEVAQLPYPRIGVVITLRADFFEHCLHYEKLRQIINQQLVPLGPLTGEDLTNAVVKPASLMGYSVEPTLLGQIMTEVGSQEQGILPLLQFALFELWKRRDQQSHQLTLAQYHEMGGIQGALNRHAGRLYERLPEREKTWVRRICLQLIRPGEDTRDTRLQKSRHNLLELAGSSDEQRSAENALQVLVDGRLLVTDDERGEVQVDLAHEALMDGWKQFATWRKENRELTRLRDRLEMFHREWEANQRSDEFLLSGGPLNQMTNRWNELKADLSPALQAFYLRSHENLRQRTSYDSDISHFKQRLRELQISLDERLQAIETGEIDTSAVSELPKVFQSSRDRTDEETSLKQLKEAVDDSLESAEVFEQRMQRSHIAATWLTENQEKLTHTIVDYLLSFKEQLRSRLSIERTPEVEQVSYREVNAYMLWLHNSLRLGKPAEEQLKIMLTFPGFVYAQAFRILREVWLQNRTCNDIDEELALYLDYLIIHLQGAN